jgi:hypothetical protein
MQRSQQAWSFFTVGACLSITGVVVAQPDPATTAKGANPPNRAAKLNKLKPGDPLTPERLAVLGPKLAEKEIEQLEEMYGHKLTDQQQQAVIQSAVGRYQAIVTAQQKHRENVARALGVTVDDLTAKERAYAKLHNGKAVGGDAVNRKVLRNALQ